jgi:filamentous hemagglutinin
LKTGEVAAYGELLKTKGDGTVDRDHIPSSAALAKRAVMLNKNKPLSSAQKRRVKNAGKAISLPKTTHRQGRTYGGKNTAAQSSQDAMDLQTAATQDIAAYSGLVDAPTSQAMQGMTMTNQEYDDEIKKALKDK